GEELLPFNRFLVTVTLPAPLPHAAILITAEGLTGRSGSTRFGRKRPHPKEAHMWGGIGGLVIQAGAGGVCANIAGELLRKYDLGAVGNTISGILGGGLGAQFVVRR